MGLPLNRSSQKLTNVQEMRECETRTEMVKRWIRFGQVRFRLWPTSGVQMCPTKSSQPRKVPICQSHWATGMLSDCGFVNLANRFAHVHINIHIVCPPRFVPRLRLLEPLLLTPNEYPPRGVPRKKGIPTKKGSFLEGRATLPPPQKKKEEEERHHWATGSRTKRFMRIRGQHGPLHPF